jgi:site-specific recombinase XerD
MASIQRFKPKKGWRIYWRLYLPNGTYREKYKTSKTKSLLQTILPQVMRIEELSRRRDLVNEDLLRALNLKIIDMEESKLLSPNFQDSTSHFLTDLRNDFETLNKTTTTNKDGQRTNLYRANQLEEYFKDIPIRGITPEVIEQWRATRQKNVTNTTVNQDLKLLRKYLDIAVHKGLINENTARKTKLLPEPRNRIPRCFYPEELKTLFRGLKNFKHHMHGDAVFIVRCLIYTGLRRGELCNLKPENVKLHLRQIHLRGKGQKERVIGIHRSLLKDFRIRVKQSYIVDPTIDIRTISRMFKRVCRKLGLPEALTLHSLRHTYISYLLEKGIPTKRVKELAGHFSLAVTDRYTHALPSKKIDEDVLDFE